MPFDSLAGWGEQVLALSVFLLSHVVPSRPPLRARLAAMAGERGYLLAYSALSLVLLGWVIGAAARAPYLELWPHAEWQRLAPQLAMPAASVLLIFGLSSPSPLSIGGRRGMAFDPKQPGIAGAVRHPVLWATLVWSTAHIVANSDLADVVLFGMFAVLSIAGMVIIDRRRRRRLGEEEWRRLARLTSNFPFAPLFRGWAPRPDRGTVMRIAAGLALYALLLVAHPILVGVPAILV